MAKSKFIQLSKIENIEVGHKKQRIDIQFKDDCNQNDTLIFSSRNNIQLLKVVIQKTAIHNPNLIFSPTKP